MRVPFFFGGGVDFVWYLQKVASQVKSMFTLNLFFEYIISVSLISASHCNDISLLGSESGKKSLLFHYGSSKTLKSLIGKDLDLIF